MTAEDRPEDNSRERGAALVVALLVVLLLFLLGMALLTLSEIENGVSVNDQWSGGAFYAAEAGVQGGIDQLGADPAVSTQAIPVTAIGGSYSFRSGARSDAGPQPLQFLGVTNAVGFDLNSGTGYNESGFVNNVYQVNSTGIGPRNSQREVEVRITYGPVPR